MAGVIGHIDAFDAQVEQWTSYVERFEHFIAANSITEEKKVPVLLSVMGYKTYGLLRGLIAPEKPGDKTYSTIVEVLQEHFSPQLLIIAERFRFHKRDQEEGETIAQYVSALKKLSQRCDFGDFLKDALRDRLVFGLKSESMQKRLISEAALTFEKAVEITVTMENEAQELNQPIKSENQTDDFVRVECELPSIIDEFKDEGMNEESSIPQNELDIWNHQEAVKIHEFGNSPPTSLHITGLEETSVPAGDIAELTIKPFMHIPLFNIREILMNARLGKEIIQSLEKEKSITIKQRRAMVRILVSFLIKTFGETPSADTKKSMALALVEEFPCLKDLKGNGYEAFYTPSRSHRPATGFIEERLRNIRKRLRNFRKTQVRQKVERASRLCILEPILPRKRTQNLVKWLKNNHGPFDQVVANMKDTALYRAKWIRQNGTKSIEEVVQEFPHLLNTPGMISQDFDQIHRGNGMKLFESWATFFAARILRIAIRGKKLNQSLEDIPQEITEDVALLVLPLLLPPSVYRKGRKVIRPSIDEAKNSFIELQPLGTNIVEFLHQTKVTKPFPFVLAIGNSNLIFQSFVIINGQALAQSTLLAAVDVCFKAYYVFDINYPKQCSSIWEFLQTVVFQMEGNESPAVRLLRSSLLAEE